MTESDPIAIDTFAQRLITARQSRRRIGRADAEALGSRLDTRSAYAVQALVHETFGPVEGFKTGRKSEELPVIKAPVLDCGLRPSGAVFRTGEIGSCGVELEIGFRLERTLPSIDADDFAEAVRSCVTAVPVIEIIDGRIEDFTSLPDALKLADNQMNGGLVWADPVEDPAKLDLSVPTVELRFDGRTVVTGERAVPGGNAFDIFLAFVRSLGDHCGGLKRGQIVTTGSLTGMLFIEPGTRVEGHIVGLGPVSVSYE